MTKVNGKVILLEVGNNTAVVTYIIQKHADDFANKGVNIEEIPTLIMQAIKENKVVGIQGSDRNIY